MTDLPFELMQFAQKSSSCATLHLPDPLLFAVTQKTLQQAGCSILVQCGPLVADICMFGKKDGLQKVENQNVRAVYV
jgi:hypothetical protein